MQKHRFNVRLGSVISSGERKKLVWTGRKRVNRGGEEEEAASHQAAWGMTVHPLMEQLEEDSVREKSPVLGPLSDWLLREDGTPFKAAPAPSLDKHCHDTLN